jgi:hypothetical protein
MKKFTCVLAILAAASTAAVAKDLKQDQKATAPAISSAAQMSDAEMDRVVGGLFGYGLTTAEAGSGIAPPAATFLLPPGNAVFGPGYGTSTAISTGNFTHPF